MLALRSILLGFACAAFGCSSATNVSTGDPRASADAGADAAPAPAACPVGTHAIDDGTCDAELAWQKSGTLAPARDHHVTFTATSKAGTFLYVGGGMGDMAASPVPLYDDVQMSSIAEDGTLGAWRATTSLPQKLAGPGVAVVGDAVVVTGGMIERGVSADTLVSRIGPDGALGAWAKGPPIPSGRYHHTTVAHKGWVYLVGGLSRSSLADTARAKIEADGSLGAWTKASPLPKPRSHHASLVHDGALYVFGGGDVGSTTFYVDVLRASIGDDGALGEWTKAGELPENAGAQSVVELGGFVYAFGGVKGSDQGLEVVASVRRARFQADGTLGAWEEVGKLPTARGHVHQTPLVGAHVFSIGGALDDGSPIGDVLVGTFR